MKRIYEYNKDTDLYELTIGLKALLARVSSLKEGYVWNDYCISRKLKEKTETSMTSSILSLHEDILAYRSKLEYFVENQDVYHDTTCVDKFMNGEIIVIRKQAIKSLNVLKSKARNSVDEEEKRALNFVIEDLRNSVNEWLSVVRDVLQHNRKLQSMLLNIGIDYRKKYELEDI